MAAEMKRKTPSDTCTPTEKKSLGLMFWGLDAKQRGQLLDHYKEARKVLEDIRKLQKELEAYGTAHATSFRHSSSQDSTTYDDDDISHLLQMVQNGDRENLPNPLNIAGWARRRDMLQILVARSEDRLQKLAKQCAVSQCTAFTALVRSSLPRELRDQIYDHLWTVEHVERLDSVISCQNAPAWLSSSELSSSDLPVPLFADSTYLDGEFADEAAVWYFRVCIGAEINYRHVRGFLERNTFGPMSFFPRDAICRLTIDIDWYIHGRSDITYAALRDSMNSLLLLQEHKDLLIEVYLSRDLQFSRQLFPTLDIIKPVFHVLESKGPKLKVMGYQFFTPAWRDGHLAPAKKTHATVELLNYYFTRTPEEWLEMMDEEIKAIPQVPRREKCREILTTMRKNLSDMTVTTSYWRQL